jgi:hypothetical protein
MSKSVKPSAPRGVDSLLLDILRCPNEGAQDVAEAILGAAYPASSIVRESLYCYARGTIPLLLIAHTDTVHKNPPRAIHYDPDARVLWAPHGLGADDRAGVYAIASLLRDTTLRPHVLFTDEEETGGAGADLAALTLEPPAVRALIQLDRQSARDAVTYHCHCPRLDKYVAAHGFTSASGSFTDISILMPEWGIAGVNLSIGYYQQHTRGEYLCLPEMERTISAVKRMLVSPPKRVCCYAPFPAPKKADVAQDPWWDRLDNAGSLLTTEERDFLRWK